MNLKFSQLLPLLLAVSATCSLTGCDKKNSSEVSAVDIQTSEDTKGITEDNDQEVSNIDTDVDSGIPSEFSIKCKYWYDNPDVIASQQELYDLAKSGTLTDKKFLDTFPIYVDASGNEYFISGRSFYYLHDNIDTHDAFELRDEDTGVMHYQYLANTSKDFLADINKVLSDTGSEQSTNYDYYVSNKEMPVLNSEVKYDVFINNIKCPSFCASSGSYLPIASCLHLLNLGTYVVFSSNDISDGVIDEPIVQSDDDYTDVHILYLCTAAGQITVTFTRDLSTNTYTVDYSTGEAVTVVGTNGLFATDSELFMSPQAIEQLLGFHVEVYGDKAVNIITDNKDIATIESGLPG